MPVHAQRALAPPRSGGGRRRGQSAVIDVNRARTAPIPIAIPDLGGSDGSSGQLGHDIAGVISNDLAQLRPVPADRPAAFIQGGTGARRDAQFPELEGASAPRRW